MLTYFKVEEDTKMMMKMANESLIILRHNYHNNVDVMLAVQKLTNVYSSALQTEKDVCIHEAARAIVDYFNLIPSQHIKKENVEKIKHKKNQVIGNMNVIETIDSLENMQEELRSIRDMQTAIPCAEIYEFCVCEDFDCIVDFIEKLIEKFKNQ